MYRMSLSLRRAAAIFIVAFVNQLAIADFSTRALLIEVILADGSARTISASAVAPDRVLTARHAVEGMSSAWINLGNAGVVPIGGVVYDNPDSDLVVLSAALPDTMSVVETMVPGCWVNREVFSVRRMPNGQVVERSFRLDGMNFWGAEPILNLTPGVENGWSGSPVIDRATGHLMGVLTRSGDKATRSEASIVTAAQLLPQPDTEVTVAMWPGRGNAESVKAKAALLRMLVTPSEPAEVGELARAFGHAKVAGNDALSLEAVYMLGTRSRSLVELAQGFEELVDSQPNNWHALFYAGWAASEAGKPVEALRFYERAKAIRPSAGLDIRMTSELRKLGRSGQALALLSAVSSSNPCFFEAHQSLYTTQRDAGRPFDSDLAQRLLLSKPGDELVLLVVAADWRRAGRPIQQLDSLLDKLSSIDPFAANRLRLSVTQPSQ